MDSKVMLDSKKIKKIIEKEVEVIEGTTDFLIIYITLEQDFDEETRNKSIIYNIKFNVYDKDNVCIEDGNIYTIEEHTEIKGFKDFSGVRDKIFSKAVKLRNDMKNKFKNIDNVDFFEVEILV